MWLLPHQGFATTSAPVLGTHPPGRGVFGRPAALQPLLGGIPRAAGCALRCIPNTPRRSQLRSVNRPYNMPVMDGLALVVATRRRHPGLPVVLASGFIDDALRERAMALGVRGLVQKER